MDSESKTNLEHHWFLKVIVTGEPGVGKTSLVEKYVSGHFLNDYKASIGVNMYVKKLNVEEINFAFQMEENSHIDIQLWDIAGHERWNKTRHLYYAGAQGALIIGDLTREKTFEEIERFWYPDLVEHCNKIPVILIGNKSDLPRKINQDKIKDLSKKIEAIDSIYTSAKTGNNVEEAFRLIAEKIIEKSEKT
ncbi:MAG: GTP-binding protein [Promethearchaeia archaeon]